MKKYRLTRHITGIISTVVLVAVAFFIPWHEVGGVLRKLQLLYLALLLILALTYLAFKAFRFSRMLRLLGIEIEPLKAALLYLSAQQFTFLPGGELVRTQQLKEYAGVAIRNSTAAIVQQGLLEAVSLLLASIVCAIMIGRGTLPLIAAAIVFALFLYASRTKKILLHPTLLKLISKLPFIKVNKTALDDFIESNQKLISMRALPELIALSLLPIMAGIGIIFVSARALGQHLSLLQSAVSYILPAALAYVAVVPGTSEGGTVGILVIIGLSFAAAVSITFLTHAFLMGINFIIGPLCLILVKRKYHGNQQTD